MSNDEHKKLLEELKEEYKNLKPEDKVKMLRKLNELISRINKLAKKIK